MSLTRRQRHDTHDVDRFELRLIRVGHALWALLRRERRQRGIPLREIGALEEAIQTIVRLKREYRAELTVRRAERSRKVRERFAKNVAS